MDCQNYLEKLDAVFPGSEGHEDPELREAFAHLSECEHCSREFEERQEFDRQVAERMRDVPVPVEAKERLLRRLDETEAYTVVPSAHPTTTRIRFSGVLPKFVAVAAVLAVGLIGLWVTTRGNATMTMDEVQATVGQRFAEMTTREQYESLQEFNGDFDPSIEDWRWNAVTSPTPRGIDLNDDGTQDAAVYWIGTPVTGVLLVLSPDFVSDPPGATSPGGVSPKYSPVRVAWRPAGCSKVHLCVLPGSTDDRGGLERLLSVVIGSRAA